MSDMVYKDLPTEVRKMLADNGESEIDVKKVEPNFRTASIAVTTGLEEQLRYLFRYVGQWQLIESKPVKKQRKKKEKQDE